MNLRTLVATVSMVLLGLVIPAAAIAHPMGNFSINHYSKIITGERTVEVDYIIDMAEIPTFQEIQRSGIVARADDPGLAPYLRQQSELLKEELTLDINGRPLVLKTVSRHAIFPPGAGGLPTMKMGFVYQAALPQGSAATPLSLHYQDHNFPDRAGWKEIVAVARPGAAVLKSSVPDRDRSQELTNYPTDVLHSPPQSLDANVTFKAIPTGGYASDKSDDAAHLVSRSAALPLGARLEANRQGTPRSAFTDLIESNRADLAFLLIAALIAAVLGGFHALEPGHGKTLVAAYLVGSSGTARDAIMLGAVVTASHTISVYALGLVTVYASQWLLPEQLYPWLGVGSGLLVAGLGFTLFIRRYLLVNEISPAPHAHDHGYDHEHDHSHDHEHLDEPYHRHTWWGGHANAAHSHRRIHTHVHDDGHSHSHSHTSESDNSAGLDGVSLKNLFVLGITGGVVPCPAALVVLLGALALHRVAFGLFLIVAFSVGLAAVLIGFGLAMVYAGQFMSRFAVRGPLTERWLPLASSAVIAVVGVTIALRSLATI